MTLLTTLKTMVTGKRTTLVLTAEEQRAHLDRLAHLHAGIIAARKTYLDLRDTTRKLAKASYGEALKRALGEIPGSFKGTYRGVPGVFYVDQESDCRQKGYEDSIDYLPPEYEVRVSFCPLLACGLIIRHYCYPVLLANREIDRIALWPEGTPFPEYREFMSMDHVTGAAT